MNNSQIIRLPFLSTIGRSFTYTFTNLGTIFKISLSWFLVVIMALVGGYLYCTADMQGYEGVNADKLSYFLVAFSVLLTIIMLAIQVSFCRRTILHQNFKPFHITFGPREWKYFLYTFLIVAVIVAPVVVISEALFLAKVNDIYSSYILSAVFVISAIISSRFILALPAIAVDNYDIRMKKSWEMTKDNANRIFWGLIILAIPGYVCFILLGMLSTALGATADTATMKIIFLVLIFMVSFIDVSIKASYYGHVYQYFTYFSKPYTKVVIEKEVTVVYEAPAVKKAPAKPVAKKETAPVKKAPVKKVPAPKKEATKAAPQKAPSKAAAKPAAKKAVAKPAPQKAVAKPAPKKTAPKKK